jgi:hypothetical protein
MPTPGAAQKQIAKLAGNWSGDEVMAPSPWDPKGGTAKGKATNRVACDGWVVIQEYEQARDGKVTFRGHGVFSHDDKKNQAVLNWYDSMGGGPGVFTGTWKGDVLAMTGPSGMGGTARLTFDVTGGAYKFTMEASQDGKKWMELMRGSYKK